MRIMDWSSDVCSSYLELRAKLLALREVWAIVIFHETFCSAHTSHDRDNKNCFVLYVTQLRRQFHQQISNCVMRHTMQFSLQAGELQRLHFFDREGMLRSEVRRVGKECVSTCR